MPNNPGGGPPDKWIAIKLVSDQNEVSSATILAALNNPSPDAGPVTGAFTQQCLDGLFLFLGFYGDKE